MNETKLILYSKKISLQQVKPLFQRGRIRTNVFCPGLNLSFGFFKSLMFKVALSRYNDTDKGTPDRMMDDTMVNQLTMTQYTLVGKETLLLTWN